MCSELAQKKRLVKMHPILPHYINYSAHIIVKIINVRMISAVTQIKTVR